MEEPAGFGIRYIWTAQADGPALQSGLKSREYITPYRPIIVSIAGELLQARITLQARLILYQQTRSGYTKRH